MEEAWELAVVSEASIWRWSSGQVATKYQSFFASLTFCLFTSYSSVELKLIENVVKFNADKPNDLIISVFLFVLSIVFFISFVLRSSNDLKLSDDHKIASTAQEKKLTIVSERLQKSTTDLLGFKLDKGPDFHELENKVNEYTSRLKQSVHEANEAIENFSQREPVFLKLVPLLEKLLEDRKPLLALKSEAFGGDEFRWFEQSARALQDELREATNSSGGRGYLSNLHVSSDEVLKEMKLVKGTLVDVQEKNSSALKLVLTQVDSQIALLKPLCGSFLDSIQETVRHRKLLRKAVWVERELLGFVLPSLASLSLIFIGSFSFLRESF